MECSHHNHHCGDCAAPTFEIMPLNPWASLAVTDIEANGEQGGDQVSPISDTANSVVADLKSFETYQHQS